jgi:putative flavoprotein involved in K+ transport
MSQVLDVIVIGAGHAGLSISYYLKKFGLKHVVLEQHKIGNSWFAQRWDSFKLNTPNKTNILPGMQTVLADPDGFISAKDFVRSLNQYVRKFELPVMENSRVTSLEKSNLFSARALQEAKEKKFDSKKVVIASGSQNKKIIPDFSKKITSSVRQLHASEYHNAGSLPAGAVLVVGSGQSGVQISEDLLDAGKKVYLSTSKVARLPRRYRGKDVVEWITLTGIWDVQTEAVPDPQMLTAKQPQISGVGLRGRTVSLQGLARKGAVILGKLEDADADGVHFKSNADEHIKFADAFSQQFKDLVDDYITKTQMNAAPVEVDEDDLPDTNADRASAITSLNFKNDNITSVIWATGFGGDFSYLRLPVFNPDGTIKHENGISAVDGLYVCGFPWLRKRKSGIVLGIDEDAKFISEKIRNTIN